MKKNSSIKGLLLLFLIFAIVGSLVIYFVTRENMTVKVFVYDSEGLVEGAIVSVKEQKKMTSTDGSIEFGMLVDLGDTLLIKAEYNNAQAQKIYVIDSVRYFTQYGICDIQVLKE